MSSSISAQKVAYKIVGLKKIGKCRINISTFMKKQSGRYTSTSGPQAAASKAARRMCKKLAGKGACTLEIHVRRLKSEYSSEFADSARVHKYRIKRSLILKRDSTPIQVGNTSFTPRYSFKIEKLP